MYKLWIMTNLLVILCNLSYASQLGAKSVWNGYNNPYRMNPNFEANFLILPLSGELATVGYAWPGSYWPNYRGGIAWRWSADDPQDFRYHSPSLEEAKQMTSYEINQLSPAEKYDLYVGSYDYPTVKKQWRYTSPSEPRWHGICHGVAPASVHHKEPASVTLLSIDEVEITFYASDVKALLANHYARESNTSIIQIGKRCFWLGSGCSDVNAGAFHLIMANKLGITKVGFVADIDRRYQVWNHAAVKYDTKIIEEIALAKPSFNTATTRVKVQTTVLFAATIAPERDPVVGTQIAQYYDRYYTYYLDLNSDGDIVGGDWVSYDRPDFLWYKEKDVFAGYWEKLNEIYRESVKYRANW